MTVGVKQQSESSNAKDKSPKEWWGTRYTFTLMASLGFANIYAMRVNLSVAIVAMVGGGVANKTVGTECPVGNNVDPDSSDNLGPQYDWNTQQQGDILGAFFYGYIATQIPGGFLAEKYGGKWIYGLGTLCTAILTLLTPLAASGGVGWFMALRVLEGLGEGVTYPAIHAMMSKWVPLTERSKLVSIVQGGAQLGTIISFPVSGVLSANLGWPSVFYFFGACGLVWFIFWVLLVFNNPSVHPRISEEEKNYIDNNMALAPTGTNGGKLPPPPFKQLFTSVPMLAFSIAAIGQSWGFYTLLTEIPTYLSDILHFSLQSNGFISALPYLCMFLASFPFGWMCDWINSRKLLSFSKTRKLMNTIGQIGPALGLVGLSFVGCDRTLAIVWLCVSMGLNGATYSGSASNTMDLSPNYAGTVMGIGNMVGNISGFVTPYIVGTIINGNQTQVAWRTAFLLSTGVYTVCNGVFVIWGSTEVQPWNTYWETKKQKPVN